MMKWVIYKVLFWKTKFTESVTIQSFYYYQSILSTIVLRIVSNFTCFNLCRKIISRVLTWILRGSICEYYFYLFQVHQIRTACKTYKNVNTDLCAKHISRRDLNDLYFWGATFFNRGENQLTIILNGNFNINFTSNVTIENFYQRKNSIIN